MENKYTDNELKCFITEYLANKKKIKELIRDREILTEKGTNEYYKVKSRNEELSMILDEYKVKP